MANYSIKELLACWLSRDLNDGEMAVVGANFPIPRAAVLLAHFNGKPNMRVGIGSFITNLSEVSQVMTCKFFSDFRPLRWAEYAANFNMDIFGFHKLDVFYINGIQIDAFGNTNLIGIRGKGKKFKFRGPGSIGTATLAAVARRYYIVTEHHTPRTFVEKCDYISGLGYGDGSPGLREKLHLPGKGPKYCVTPLCVFDFSPETRRMRICSLHPGVTLDQVLENTGFKPEVPDEIPVTPPPEAGELKILRQRVDTEGLLR